MFRSSRLILSAVLMAGTLLAGLARPVGAATTALTNQASSSGFPVGVGIFDVATLGMADSPTGTLTFTVFGPDNTTCTGSPLFTSTKTVNGNGNYTSDSYTTVAAGTYRWTARYSGDGNDTPASTACSDPAGQVSVAKRNASLNISVPPPANGTISASATVGNGAGPSGPTGTVTFKLYGPNNMVCSGAPIATTTRAVAGNGTYTSDPFAPTAGGTYQWVASYSGDVNNWGVSTLCVDPVGSVTFTAPRVTPVLTLSAPATARRGESVRATVSLTGGVNPTGTLTFQVYDPRDAACTGSPFLATSSAAVVGNGTYTSGAYAPATPGTYRWVARYGGDVGHNAVATTCGQSDSATAVAQVAGDYDGDGRTDVAIYRPGNGGWYLKDIGGVSWGGVPGDVPVPGDYNGDGRTDVAIYRPSTGGWYIKDIGGMTWGGVPGDVPVPGDYDGDGRTDLAVYRPSNGGWYLKDMGGVTWGGVLGDVPVPGDYDGDGDTDVAIYRPGTGGWYLYGIGAVAWGTIGDVPVPGDYNGDGRTEVGVYRPGNGGWYLKDSGPLTWGGVAGDVPVVVLH